MEASQEGNQLFLNKRAMKWGKKTNKWHNLPHFSGLSKQERKKNNK